MVGYNHTVLSSGLDMARLFLFHLVLIALCAILSCRPAPGGDTDGNGTAPSQTGAPNGGEDYVGKHYLAELTTPFDWTTVHYDKAVTVLHTFASPDDNASPARVAALNASAAKSCSS